MALRQECENRLNFSMAVGVGTFTLWLLGLIAIGAIESLAKIKVPAQLLTINTAVVLLVQFFALPWLYRRAELPGKPADSWLVRGSLATTMWFLVIFSVLPSADWIDPGIARSIYNGFFWFIFLGTIGLYITLSVVGLRYCDAAPPGRGWASKQLQQLQELADRYKLQATELQSFLATEAAGTGPPQPLADVQARSNDMDAQIAEVRASGLEPHLIDAEVERIRREHGQ